tara:strand:+ start:58 stop:927 length:870 start_codon:yes stop_codon:yes gene_type:complete
MTNTNRYNQIYILMSFAMISWAIAWTNAKIVGEYLSYYNLIFLRFLFGFLSLIPFVIIKKSKIPTLKQWQYLIIPGILFFIYNIAFFKGTHTGLSGKGAIIVTTLNPLITVLIVSILKRNIAKNEIIGMCFGIIGGLIIMNVFNEGLRVIIDSKNIYFLICAISWGFMTISINYGQKIINPYMFICLCYLITTLLSIPFANFEEIIQSNFDFRFYINFFLVSIGAMSFGTSIYIYSTPILGPSKASVFIFSVPFLAMLTANIIFNEIITVNIIIGGLLSLIAIYIVNKK